VFSYAHNPGGTCFGDSGGPAIIDRGGTLYVAGVTSFSDNDCVEFGASTRVALYEAWIASQAVAPTPGNGTSSCNVAISTGACELSCSSDTGDCSTGPDYVECDGVRSTCP